MTLALADFDEIDLSGLEIGAINWTGDRLQANFGAGYGASAVVGPTSGLWGWELSSGVLPDDTDYGNLINNTSRFDYYQTFIQDHITGDNEVFVIDFRGRKFHASFVDNSISGEMLTYDLFNLSGIKLKMRRVPDIYYLSDGSIFDPANISQVWGWYGPDDLTIDLSGGGHDLDTHGNISDTGGDAQNGFTTSRFNGGATNTGYLNTALDPKIYEAFFVIQINEATFSNYGGILSADATIVAMVGDSGFARLNNQTFGITYTYKLNGVALAEASQTTPMQEFGVIHGRWSAGITLANMQIGKDRAATDRYLEADIGEIVLCDGLLSNTDNLNMDAYLMRKWGISA